MSSMDRTRFLFASLLAGTSLAVATPAAAQASPQVDQARRQLVAMAPAYPAQAAGRWTMLTGNAQMSFADYAGFLLAFPGFPREELLRTRAEDSLERSGASPEQLVAYFAQYPALTNPGRARHALALQALGRPEAFEAARAAWRGGKMSSAAEMYLLQALGGRLTAEDQDERMRALLWQGDAEAAARQIAYVSPAYRATAMARLSLLQGTEPASIGVPVPAEAQRDPGYVYNLARYYRRTSQGQRAASLLASRPTFASLPADAEDFVSEMLVAARASNARDAVRIAGSSDDLFAPGTDISTLSLKLRDDYTTLKWLGGTQALWQLGDGAAAAPLFYRYGAAARTPQTKSKGFYWAGRAAQQAGDQAGATRYFEMAAGFPEYYYGLLALERLGRAPAYSAQPPAMPTAEQRAAFAASPMAQAIRVVGGQSDWRTARYFYTQLADTARSESELMLAAELAREQNLPELAVVVGRTAPEKGYTSFTRVGFPTVETPAGVNWTMVHAIARQESEFDDERVSHAGAQGLMQLMPGTAREQAGRIGLSSSGYGLTGRGSRADNIRLGDSYFSRMLAYYNGSYPLAVAAYNAGPGNVNRWLRSNGDPRNGGIEWVRWIELIPIFETRNYVQRVLENAVVYEHLHPERTLYGTPRGISRFIGKSTPG